MNGDTFSIKAPKECSKKFAATVKRKFLARGNVLRIFAMFLEGLRGRLYRKGVATQVNLTLIKSREIGGNYRRGGFPPPILHFFKSLLLAYPPWDPPKKSLSSREHSSNPPSTPQNLVYHDGWIPKCLPWFTTCPGVLLNRFPSQAKKSRGSQKVCLGGASLKATLFNAGSLLSGWGQSKSS